MQLLHLLHEMTLTSLRASGFIGFPVAQALSRAGYQVYGLVRTDAEAKQLAKNEGQSVLYMYYDHLN
jgi:nucleoside-diphosphate-sugar epimerase